MRDYDRRMQALPSLSWLTLFPPRWSSAERASVRPMGRLFSDYGRGEKTAAVRRLGRRSSTGYNAPMRVELEPNRKSTGASEQRAEDGMCRGIPGALAERDRIRRAADAYVREAVLLPPLSLDDLRRHTNRIMAAHHIDGRFLDFVTILVANALWRDTVAAVPFERRVFLLPQCLRAKDVCEADIDEFGLLCMQCGGCPIGRLQEEAEELGYVCLVAEGTTVVTRLLAGGKVDAVIGVSCLDTLERTFPHMATHAVPGIAIPLLRDGCEATDVDVEWVREALALRDERQTVAHMGLRDLQECVAGWFTPDALVDVLGYRSEAAEAVAVDWLARGGKRWRPFLVAGVYAALNGSHDAFPAKVRRCAVAVECFHKASLVHDDIEDDDDERYQQPTLHCQVGMPVALNTGDLLVGEGYRLLVELDAPSEEKNGMLAAAVEGHHMLCLGQGEELVWMRNPGPLSVAQVLDLFCRKTAPAFEVALRLGALCGGAPPETGDLLKRFSASLGMAYQIRDDLEDYAAMSRDNDMLSLRPSLLMAMAFENASPEDRARMLRVLRRETSPDGVSFLVGMAEQAGAPARARQLFEHHRNESLRCLAALRQAPLKSLLHRVTGRILRDVDAGQSGVGGQAAAAGASGAPSGKEQTS